MQTKLRYIKTKDADKIVEYVSKLIPYRVEIKGNPVFVSGKWFLWFNLPDKDLKELPFGDLD